MVIMSMARAFFASILLPDLAEGAKKFGNMFHALSDTFSETHTTRQSAAQCNAQSITMARVAELKKLKKSPKADKDENSPLYKCATFYGSEALMLFVQARNDFRL